MTFLIKFQSDEQNDTQVTTINEQNGGSVKNGWKFEIFHGDFLNGIRQTNPNSEITEIGCTDGDPETTILLSDGEYVTKVEFSGLD